MNKTYIDQLKNHAAQANLLSEEVKAKSHKKDSRVLCDIPLTVQIEVLMRSLSPTQRNRPWSMDELLPRLRGRYSARPHPMNVGSALRQLGWRSKRDWTRDGDGRRIWVKCYNNK